MAQYSEEIRTAARRLYLMRKTPKEIQEELGLNSWRVVYTWAKKYHWVDALSTMGTEEAITRRLESLLPKENKSDSQLKELELLIEHQVKMAKVRVDSKIKEQGQRESASSSDEERKPQDRQRFKRKKKGKNYADELTLEDFKPWLDSLWEWQLDLFEERNQRGRGILKTRQCGASYYFAGEAFITAVVTGKTQLFVSASKSQAMIFNHYIKVIAKTFFEIDLKGTERITLSNGAALVALPSNARNIEGYSGDLYFDEFAWVNNFSKFKDRASGVTSQSDRRRTFLSTASIMAHPSFAWWNGDEWRSGDKERERLAWPSDQELRKNPQVCPDGIWRIVLTIDDVIAKGQDRLNREQLENEYTITAFQNLFLCIWIDDAEAVFSFSKLQKCIKPSERWGDVEWQDMGEGKAPMVVQYLGEVALGYDPSRSRDDASLVVLAVPKTPKDKWRTLEVHRWQNLSWEYQAREIEKLCKKYKVVHLGIDASGPGSGVYEMALKFYPNAKKIMYTNKVKSDLVLKAIQTINAQRLLWDPIYNSIAPAFMAIRRDTTKGGVITYVASRTQTLGHADVFFAICHALDYESMTYDRDSSIKFGVVE